MNVEKGFPLFFVLLIISKQVEIWLDISINRRVNDHLRIQHKNQCDTKTFLTRRTGLSVAGQARWGGGLTE